jgi:subtilase family serine protease
MKKPAWILALALCAIGLGPPAGAQQPDLTLAGLTVNAGTLIKCASSTINVTLTETNAGTARAGRHYVDLMGNLGTTGPFVPLCRKLVPGLLAGASQTITFNCVYYNGPCDCLPTTYNESFQGLTDSLANVAESNESNNSSNVVVAPATCP